VSDATKSDTAGRPAVGFADSRPPRHVRISWEPEHHRFVAVGTSPHPIHLNAPRPDDVAPTGFSPAELVLAGAGACSAWDVVHILAKGRERLVDVEVFVEGRQDDQEPHPFRDVTLRYVVTGSHLRREAVERAVRLSHERYCSAIATIRGVAAIAFSIDVRDADVRPQSPVPGAAAPD
jgi:putative redox protein